MDDYRSLTEDEITRLEDRGCSAEDWTAINVDEDFQPDHITNVDFYGEVSIGVFDKNIEVDEGFLKHSGISNAVLKDVSVGDNSLIEGTGNYINNYDISEGCYISNVGKISCSPDATFGEGNIISVKDEGGNGNVMIFSALSSQLASVMVSNAGDKTFTNALRQSIRKYITSQRPKRGLIGYRAKIINTTEITNTIINDDCEISGASRISECSILSTPEASSYIGNNVIADYCIIQAGASILDGANVNNCFVGEACHIGKGATAETSLFFANSYIDNGETCAAFCGPFTVSHHKSTLLIGGEYSFYNAGSNTNFSNHAYKMGPIHYGTMERGSKTASGAHILWPATIGSFSMCMGKIATHPQCKELPFSYIFGYGKETRIIPGRNLVTVGTYRDIHKWVKRDMRPHTSRLSLINFNRLNPVTILECLDGIKILKRMQTEPGDSDDEYCYNGTIINSKTVEKAIRYYEMAITLFIGDVITTQPLRLPDGCIGTGEWTDLSGMVAPKSEIDQLISNISSGNDDDIIIIADEMENIFRQYDDYVWNFTYHLISSYYNLDTITDEDITKLKGKYKYTVSEWTSLICRDAEKEYELGDVNEEMLNDFLDKIKEEDKSINEKE